MCRGRRRWLSSRRDRGEPAESFAQRPPRRRRNATPAGSPNKEPVKGDPAGTAFFLCVLSDLRARSSAFSASDHFFVAAAISAFSFGLTRNPAFSAAFTSASASVALPVTR